MRDRVRIRVEEEGVGGRREIMSERGVREDERRARVEEDEGRASRRVIGVERKEEVAGFKDSE